MGKNIELNLPRTEFASKPWLITRVVVKCCEHVNVGHKYIYIYMFVGKIYIYIHTVYISRFWVNAFQQVQPFRFGMGPFSQ